MQGPNFFKPSAHYGVLQMSSFRPNHFFATDTPPPPLPTQIHSQIGRHWLRLFHKKKKQ